MSERSARDEWQAAFDETRLRDTAFSTRSGVDQDPVHGDAPFPGQYP